MCGGMIQLGRNMCSTECEDHLSPEKAHEPLVCAL